MANVVLFNFDSTLVKTRSARMIRESLEYDLLTPETKAQVAPYRPVPEVIRELKEHGVLLGIVSNVRRGYIERILAHLKSNKPMVRRTNWRNGNRLWGCTGYCQTVLCNYTEDLHSGCI